MPRPCAVIISQMAAAMVATGWSAISTIRPAAASMFVLPDLITVPAPPPNGPMPPQGSMAISSTSLPPTAALKIFATFATRSAAFSACRRPSFLPARCARRRDRRKPRAGYFAPGSRSREPMPKPICTRLHHRVARRYAVALPSQALVSARRQSPPRGLAGTACRRHRCAWPDHRRSSHVARSRPPRKGATARSAAGARASPRPWRALRPSQGRSPRRRGDRDRLVAEIHLASDADDCGTIRQPSRGVGIHAGTHPAVCRARPGCSRPYGIRTTPRAGMAPESRYAISSRYREISTRIYARQDLMRYSLGFRTSLLRMMSCGFKARLSAVDPIPAIARRQPGCFR
jgi:hypothetical protein